MRSGIMIIFMIICTSSIAGGEISISISCYNNDDVMSIGMSGENVEYSGFVLLEPDYISYKNGGTSTFPESRYSFSASLNGNGVFSSASTDSGTFKWGADISAGYDEGDRKESMQLSASHAVVDGELWSQYGNELVRGESELTTIGAKYKETVNIEKQTLKALGMGEIEPDPVDDGEQEPLEDPVIVPVEALVKLSGFIGCVQVGPVLEGSEESDAEPIMDYSGQTSSTDTASSSGSSWSTGGIFSTNSNAQPDSVASATDSQLVGFFQQIKVDGGSAGGSMKTAVLGDLSGIWKFGINGEGKSSYSFGMGTEGISTGTSSSTLQMEGSATNIPKQVLPPGQVVVTEYTLPEPDYYGDLAKVKTEEFYSTYPSSSGIIPPTSTYLLDQEVYLGTPVVLPDTNKNSAYTFTTGEYYRMNMGFTVGGFAAGWR